MPLPKLLVAGCSGHARVIADIVRQAGEYCLIGFYDREPASDFCNLPVYAGADALAELRASGVGAAVVGIGDATIRRRVAAELRAAGFCLPPAIHPRACVAPDVAIGEGTVIMAGAVINPGAHLGELVIVNTCASVDHDGDIGDAAHIAPGSHLAGSVRVGREVWIGAGATVIDGLTIGERSLVGAGAVVVRDVPGDVVAYGVPARIIRPR